jgi:hypothetical protein
MREGQAGILCRHLLLFCFEYSRFFAASSLRIPWASEKGGEDHIEPLAAFANRFISRFSWGCAKLVLLPSATQSSIICAPLRLRYCHSDKW